MKKKALMKKQPLVLNLSPAEMDALEALSEKRGMTKTALARVALHLYQVVCSRQESGHKLYFERKASPEKTEVVVL